MDLRDIVVGDAHNWSWERPLSDISYIAIHHSATSPSATPQEIAKYHVEKNSWGGIGYHFVISKEGTVFYVGDISTARANVANMNEKVLGICLIGNFTRGQSPTVIQLDSCKKLIDFLINYKDLISLNGWNCVKAHREFPRQSTICPGDNWQSWFKILTASKPTFLNSYSVGLPAKP